MVVEVEISQPKISRPPTAPKWRQGDQECYRELRAHGKTQIAGKRSGVSNPTLKCHLAFSIYLCFDLSNTIYPQIVLLECLEICG